jgi:hypothetical protein
LFESNHFSFKKSKSVLAPIDKIRNGGNDILQIEITRKCDLFNCSNCTRLLPFRRDPIEMSLDVFEQAVDSLADWPGIVAVFGGNPCTHSRFPEICRSLAPRIPPRQRGLWTNHTREHGAIAAYTFGAGRLNLNAHGDPLAYAEMDRWFPGQVIAGTDDRASWHAAILVDYRDFGITEADWIRRREQCDINRNWSAIIQEQDGQPVAYFCEVAGAIDGSIGGRQGVPVFPGWWREPMTRFAHQVGACCDRGCAIPLRLKGHQDCDAVYDLSPSWLPHLKIPTGRVEIEIHETAPAGCRETTDYVRRRS